MFRAVAQLHTAVRDDPRAGNLATPFFAAADSGITKATLARKTIVAANPAPSPFMASFSVREAGVKRARQARGRVGRVDRV